MGDGKLGRQRRNDNWDEAKEKLLFIPEDGSKMTYCPKGRFLVPYLIVFTTLFITFTYYWLNSKYALEFRLPRQTTWNAAGGFNGFYPVRKLAKNNNNIFFIETSCVKRQTTVVNGSIHLNSRQACAIYSAAIKNPSRYIVLFHSCLLDQDYYERYYCRIYSSTMVMCWAPDCKHYSDRNTCKFFSIPKDKRNTWLKLLRSSPPVQEILQLPNVAVVNMDIIDIYLGSILQPLLISGKLSRSQYPIEHNADILRILLVYLFGGTYMDMDVISLKPLDGLGQNYIGAQEANQLGSGVFQFNYDGIGHEYLKKILIEIVQNYDPNSWAGNGPVLAGNVLKEFCNMSETVDWRIVGRIPGCNITVHPLTTFYPIDYHNWKFYYNETKKDLVIDELKETYVVHVWNHLSHGADIMVGSNQPYGILARDHCPPVYWKSKPIF